MDGTVLPSLPGLKLYTPRGKVDAEAIVQEWLSRLQECLDQKHFDNLSELFIKDCWWRDVLGLAWDFATKRGQDEMGSFLNNSKASIKDLKACDNGGLKPALIEWAGQAWVQAAFTFRNEHGKGRGVVRLENDVETRWKAWTVYTELEELHSQKEVEVRRLQSRAAREKEPQVNGTSHASREEADVLIVGAGQAGVSLGARLKHMGVNAVLIERHPAVGDAWRARYDSVTLNTPTFTDHYPFMKYPENWPEWLTGRQCADFLEHYSQLMGLDVLLNTTVTSVQRSGDRFTVTAQGPQGTQEFQPRHVVLATGVYGDKPLIPQFPGQERFQGTIYHSSQRKSGRLVPDLSQKRVVVIGCSTSGHDVAQDFVNCGAKQVVMVQRHPIFTLSTDSWKTLQLGLWNMPGLTTEEADIVGNSLPIAVVRTMSIGLTRAAADMDKALLDGLRAAGMALRTGDDGYGLADHQLIKGGHYYVDQGACAMIADGRIRVHRCEDGVREIGETAVVLADGTSIEADVVVLATGFEKNIENVRALMGDEVANQLVGFGDLDAEQERTGWWRPTGVEGFWYMTGSFLWCRQFSRVLALQIAANLEK
ncbi:Indole-3-pyruvate monooxygenase YUCCA6 [Beauveria bassiana]|nr:Indole-3-pyruvate monooxygenase YUCCA6 [Beauveria bassiana]